VFGCSDKVALINIGSLMIYLNESCHIRGDNLNKSCHVRGQGPLLGCLGVLINNVARDLFHREVRVSWVADDLFE